MRAQYGQLLRKIFAAEVKASLARFEPASLAPGTLSAGERAFVSSSNGQTHSWVVLVPSAKDDEFTVEIGWSKCGRFPELSARPWPIAPLPSPEVAECMCRIGLIAGIGDCWWHVDRFMRTAQGKEILSQLSGALQSDPATRLLVCARAAIGLVASHGVPFLAAAA